jgi:biopolymer transport protein ExbB
MLGFLEYLNPAIAVAGLRQFLEMGGNVLVVIMAATFILWAMIVERYWYFWGAHRGVAKHALSEWGTRSDHKSWQAHKIRDHLLSDVRINTEQNLGGIRAMVAVAPLLGLLGTVTGMVEVFDVMAFTGSSNARAMASGVSKATIPTMAGMVASLSGLFFSAALERRARREVQEVADKMVIE